MTNDDIILDDNDDDDDDVPGFVHEPPAGPCSVITIYIMSSSIV